MPRMPSLALALALLASVAHAADWQQLPGSPFGARFDDIHFISPDEGWVVSALGQIWHTEDGGDTWDLQLDESGTFLYFRSVGFANDQVGWAGTLSSEAPLYRTTDGGQSWAPVDNLPTSPAPIAICGIHVVDESTMFAVGVYSGPAYVLRTTDGGASWTGTELPGTTATALIDVRFTDAMNGIAVGAVGPDAFNGTTIVLQTSDGGDTWLPAFTGTVAGSWAWKLDFPSSMVGYVSVERFSGPHHFLKTIDGGATWTEEDFVGGAREQGIGFVTEDLGWIGGPAGENPTFITTDGGETWAMDAFGLELNRFQFFGPDLGYAGGDYVYKYSDETPVSVADTAPAAEPVTRSTPNPFRPRTTISYQMPTEADVHVFVTDPGGRLVRTLTRATRSAGTHEVVWDGKDDRGAEVAPGIYLYVIRSRAVDAIGKLVKVE